MAKEGFKLVANNKKAYHDYFIEEKYEAGLALHGTEVKSLRMGKCSIKEAFVRIEQGEVFVYGMHVSPYEKGNIFNKDPLRVKNSCFIGRKSAGWKAGLRKKDIRLYHCRFISGTDWPRWKLVLPRAKNYMTSVRTLQKKISAGKRKKNLKSVICS